MERILESENLHQAWRRVKANAGAAGVDGLTIAEFPAYARKHWNRIREQLKRGTYRPSPVRRQEIPKPDGGTRPLGIPTILDRVIQQAIAQGLGPIWDPDFSDRSYGFRPGRSAHGAIYRLRDDLQTGRRTAVDLDLAKYFDRVNQDILMNRLSRRIGDRTLLKPSGDAASAGRIKVWRRSNGESVN